jgi:formate dehydrogenase subunit gamma
MKKFLAGLALGLSLLAAGAAVADTKTPVPADGIVVSTPPQSPPGVASAASPGFPGVESDDILKQNQAQRTEVQPGNAAPTWRVIKEGTHNYSSLPALEAGVLIQPKAQFPGQSRASTAGEAWRQYRNGPLTTYGGWLLIVVLAGLALAYFIMGKIRVKEPLTGRLIQRFTSFERVVHWTVAICFVALAFTGLAMLFGKYVVLPLFGHTLFGWIAYTGKNIHNFVGPLFAASVVVMFVTFVRDNLPALVDLAWLKRLGGLLGKGHVHAGRFNGGEKIWFWFGVVGLGLLVSASGFVLDMLVPGVIYTRGNMQIANVVHLIGAVLISGFALGHIYLGTIGMEGAYAAMRNGYVDDTWAKEHHDLWYEDVVSGKVPRVRSPDDGANAGAPVKAV